MEQKETARLILPSNSITKKGNGGQTDEKSVSVKVEKVVTSAVHVKKKGFIRRVTSKLLADDAQNIKTFIITDTIIPAIRNLIYDMFVGALDMSLFGGVRSRGRRKDNNRSYVSYQSYYDNPRRDRPSERRNQNAKTNIDDVVFESRGEAEMVLTSMIDIIEEYNQVSIANFYELVGITGEFTDNKYGWTNLASAKVNRMRDGYIIDLPRPVLLD